MKWASFFLLGSIAGLITAEVLDLGPLDQYEPITSDIPVLSGKTIWVSTRREDGFDVALSADIQCQVQGALENCGGGPDSRCFHAVLGVLQAAYLRVDARTEARAFLARLDATFRTRAGFLAFYAGVLQSQWAGAPQPQRFDELPRPGHFFPYAKAGEAALLAAAGDPVTVRAAGVTAWTLTPSPVPTKVTLQGLVTPEVTEYLTPTQPRAEDDGPDAPAVTEWVARLDADLARQIEEALRQPRGECADGRRLDAAEPTGRRRRGGGYMAAICGAEALAPMVGAGGPFHDLLLLRGPDPGVHAPPVPPPTFRQPAAERAALAVRGFFAEAAATPLGLEAAHAHRLGTFLFALAVDALVDGHALGAENRIDATAVPGAGGA